MKKLNDEIMQFFRSQSFVIVTTIDRTGMPHNSCKGIVDIDSSGKVYLLDTYLKITRNNLIENPKMSITAVDEHGFQGYCLKGHPSHPESLLPNPEYLIAVTITQIVDLSPFPPKAGGNND